MELLFWLSVLLIVYGYFIYPILVFILSEISQTLADSTHTLFRGAERQVSEYRDQEPRTHNSAVLPNVTVVIAAFNEEQCIQSRIENLLTLDYPQDKLTLLVGSDGSSDQTADILRSIKSENLHPRIFEQNRGKMSVLNDLISEAQDEIIVLSDANTHFEKNALQKLVRHFEDAQIGAVCGELHLVDSQSKENRDSLYWRYEQKLKLYESRLNALLGANGAIYAIRKSLFQPLPAKTIVDDYQIAMNVAKQGYRLLYDPDAVAIEEVAPNLQAEVGRRIRIGMGNYQAFFSMPWVLNPLLGWRFFTYISHKVCRWFAPHFMLIAFVSNLLLVDKGFYQIAFVGQMLFYLSAWIGIRSQRKEHRIPGVISLITFFVSMNIALFQGFIKYLRSDVQGTWQRTTR